MTVLGTVLHPHQLCKGSSIGERQQVMPSRWLRFTRGTDPPLAQGPARLQRPARRGQPSNVDLFGTNASVRFGLELPVSAPNLMPLAIQSSPLEQAQSR